MGDGLQQMGFLALVALAVGGLLLAILYPYFSGAKQTEKRVKAVTLDAKAPVRQSLRARLMSQEAKASAAIIGSLPFVIMGALTVLNPAYLNPLWDTTIGNFLVIGSGVWMLIGILIMQVTLEPLADAVERIAARYGRITSIKRF